MKHILLCAAITAGFTLASSAADDAAIAANYTKHCVACHGKDGKGQTTMGKKLNAKDFTDKKVIAEIKDDEALKILKEGLKDKAGKEVKKPFAGKLSEDEMKALIAYTKSFAK